MKAFDPVERQGGRNRESHPANRMEQFLPAVYFLLAPPEKP
jgi:hypothetical protein